MKKRPILGIDIGGSGIKGAPVDLTAGELAADRFKLLTPSKSTPKNVAKIVAEVAEHFADQVDADAPIGITVPAVVTGGVTRTAANIDSEWIDCDAEKLLSDKLGRPVHLVNDADAAGACEARFGAAQNQSGLVIVTTLGTGIGTALLHNGVLIPNSEFGHIEIDGKDAETVASSGVRDKKGLSFKEWAPRLQKYYAAMEALFWPDLFVVGGGVSKDSEKFLPRLELRTPIVAAEHRNNAGIIGAAWLASQKS